MIFLYTLNYLVFGQSIGRFIVNNRLIGYHDTGVNCHCTSIWMLDKRSAFTAEWHYPGAFAFRPLNKNLKVTNKISFPIQYCFGGYMSVVPDTSHVP
jgi:hypothetical protein